MPLQEFKQKNFQPFLTVRRKHLSMTELPCRGRSRGSFATAFARHPSPLTAAAAAAATALHSYTPLMLHRGVYQDPFLAYAGAERYQLPASYAASAAYTAAAARSYAAAAAAAQPVASYAAVAG
ncbi:uncharacterized protein CEXT_787171 [Caerostris extrusa]|uniref:Uncharacterized protein n=1 Tax=Caerostris extrusa TaxID=172846 RepID=A0AAV4MS30_CAEEX|nr:uncharacterized protein CEXT_787171 [Caerostris extrusa]